MPLDLDTSGAAIGTPAEPEGPGLAASPSQSRKRSRTRNLVAAGLVAAIMTVLGPVAITAGTVPVTLQIFPVVLAALLLPAEWAASAPSACRCTRTGRRGSGSSSGRPAAS